MAESYGKPLALPAEFYWALSSAIRVLETDVRACANYWPVLANWRANDVSVQKYGAQDGISKHRDYKQDEGLVAVLTIQGRARFQAFHKNCERPWLSVITRPGSLVLLRGTGIIEDDEIRPYHQISPALGNQERISIGLRCNRSKQPEDSVY